MPHRAAQQETRRETDGTVLTGTRQRSTTSGHRGRTLRPGQPRNKQPTHGRRPGGARRLRAYRTGGIVQRHRLCAAPGPHADAQSRAGAESGNIPARGPDASGRATRRHTRGSEASGVCTRRKSQNIKTHMGDSFPSEAAAAGGLGDGVHPGARCAGRAARVAFEKRCSVRFWCDPCRRRACAPAICPRARRKAGRAQTVARVAWRALACLG